VWPVVRAACGESPETGVLNNDEFSKYVTELEEVGENIISATCDPSMMESLQLLGLIIPPDATGDPPWPALRITYLNTDNEIAASNRLMASLHQRDPSPLDKLTDAEDMVTLIKLQRAMAIAPSFVQYLEGVRAAYIRGNKEPVTEQGLSVNWLHDQLKPRVQRTIFVPLVSARLDLSCLMFEY
jgi:hypothetical protein